jgi:predicted TIM-barrel fold metal-dependent hydrolase
MAIEAKAISIFDADNHYYEPLDAFTRHLAPEHRTRVCDVAEVAGRKRHVVARNIGYSVKNPTFDPIARPGALREWYRGNPSGREVSSFLDDRERIPTAYRNPGDRLRIMDDQGVDQIWLFPMLGVMYEEPLKGDPEGVSLLVKASNRWLMDDWSFNFRDRMFAAPCLSLAVLGDAVDQLEWALENGARIICLRPAAPTTANGPLRPADPYLDPFWASVAEAGITVVVHAGANGYNFNGYVQQGGHTAFDNSDESIWLGLQHERPTFDFMAALLYDRLFERFPNVRIASVENGSKFLPELFAKATGMRNKLPKRFADDPVAVFRHHVWMNPFWEDDLPTVIELVGLDHVIFGSDWPHVEGLPNPRDYLAETRYLPVAAQQLILGETACNLNTLMPA